MEAGKSTDCSGNSKESLHFWIQQVRGQGLSWRGGGRGKAWQTRSAGLGHFDSILKATEPSVCRYRFSFFLEEHQASSLTGSRRLMKALALHKESSVRAAPFQEYNRRQNLLKICPSLHRVPNPRLFTAEGIFKIHTGRARAAISPHLHWIQVGNVWQASESEGTGFKSWSCHLLAGETLSK